MTANTQKTGLTELYELLRKETDEALRTFCGGWENAVIQIISPLFGRPAQFGNGMQAISTDSVIRQYKDYIKTILAESDDATEKEKE